MCFLKEGDGDLSSNDAQVGRIRGLKELVEYALLFRRQIQVRMPLCCAIYVCQIPNSLLQDGPRSSSALDTWTCGRG